MARRPDYGFDQRRSANVSPGLQEIDRGKPAARGRREPKPLRILVVVLIVVVLFAASLSLLSGPSSDVPPAPVPAWVSYTSHGTIYINGNSGFTNASGVVWGSGTESDPYIISGWDIDASTAMGITIRNTNAHFVVRDCYVHGGGMNWFGMYLAYCVNGTISNNNLSGNNCGIGLQSSSGNTLSNNTCYSTENVGIYLFQSSNSNTVSNNTCRSSEHIGISIQESSGNTLSNNNCTDNGIGIYLIMSSNGNTLSNNSCSSNNPYGIIIQQSNGNDLSYNNCSYNGYFGIYVSQSSSYNNMSWNKVLNNGDRGVYIQDGSYNRIWNNTFTGNYGGGVQANDDGTNNWWNTSGTPHGYGNYWSTLTAPDADFDGIVDWSYNLTGTAVAKDFYPRTTPPVPIPEFSMMPFVTIVLLIGMLLARTRIRKDPV